MIILLLIVLGLCFGSFVNALVWRLHAQEQTKKNNPKLSIVHGRSMCTNCGHLLAAKDLVPLFSWLFLQGKCRYCKKPIDDKPIVELVMPLLFVLSFLVWPYSFVGLEWLRFGVWLVLLIGLVALAVYDLRWMELPNRIVYPLFTLTVLFALLQALLTHNIGYLQQASIGILTLGGIFMALFYGSGGRWMGGGDVKLSFALGCWAASFFGAFLLLFVASLLGSVYSIVLLSLGRKIKNRRIAFGPFLVLACIVVTLVGPRIISRYLLTIGL